MTLSQPRNREMALTLLRGRGWSAEDAEDAVQEASQRAAQHESPPSAEDQYRRWFLTLCRYAGLTVRRRALAQRRLLERVGRDSEVLGAQDALDTPEPGVPDIDLRAVPDRLAFTPSERAIWADLLDPERGGVDCRRRYLLSKESRSPRVACGPAAPGSSRAWPGR